ncbi:hypothetical protein Lal_00020723 [Lupinus albus]|nr:hypothetical protein Lal_00020723 [Lupinus albus]
MKRDPKVGGGVGGTREVAKNQTQHSSSTRRFTERKVNRRMEYASSGALGALDVGFTICLAALQTNKPDSWEWRHDKSKMFTVRYAYSILTSHDHVPATPYNDSFLLWKSRISLKVLSFAWRLFQNRISTKDALLRQGFSSSDGGGSLGNSEALPGSLLFGRFGSLETTLSSKKSSLLYFIFWTLKDEILALD